MPLRGGELPREHAGASQEAAGPYQRSRPQEARRGLSPRGCGAYEKVAARQGERTLRSSLRQRAPTLVGGGGGRSVKAACVEAGRTPWALTAPSAPTI
jgi:hypothetical protein